MSEIPESAVEAAVKAWDHHWGDRYGDEEVRIALKAAAPFIAAKALEDAARDVRDGMNITQRLYVRRYLRARAESIRSTP